MSEQIRTDYPGAIPWNEPRSGVCAEVGNVCIHCDELWPCRQVLIAANATLREQLGAAVGALNAVRVMFEREYTTLMLEDGNGESVTATFMPSHWREDMESVSADGETVADAILAAAAASDGQGAAVERDACWVSDGGNPMRLTVCRSCKGLYPVHQRWCHEPDAAQKGEG